MPWESLEAAARAAAGRAYCPYSHYPVGAALECEDGQVFVGCNIESASFSPTLCAERTALAAAVAAGHRRFRRIAVVAGTHRAASPCGVCRQVLFEFGPDLEVFATTLEPGGPSRTWRLAELLPDGFGPADFEPSS